jgi:hypothetical protein
MVSCKDCKSADIKSRRNYTHGKKSKPTTTLTCKKCGSTDIDVSSNKYGRRNKR